MKIDEVRQEVMGCTKCDLCKTRTKSVPGKGSVESDVIFVGEAPGRNEDQKGEPFVGAAGNKLSMALYNAGISRDEIYITNVVKCRPPNNRIPNADEKSACNEYLQQEIDIIKPKIICILGNTAFNSILGGSEITKYRGKTMRKNNQIYFLTIHPAAAIYNQELIGTLNSDIAKLFDMVRELKEGKKIRIDIEHTA